MSQPDFEGVPPGAKVVDGVWYYFEAKGTRGPILIHESEAEYAFGISSDFDQEYERVRVMIKGEHDA